jgi:hypothetical protein
MSVKATRRSATLVRINATTLIRAFAIAVWVFGLGATAWLGYSLFPLAPTGVIVLGAVLTQLVFTIGQLKVVRRYFGGLPTFFFVVDTLTNFLALFDFAYPMDYSTGTAFVQSLVTALTTGDVLINVVLVAVFVFIAHKVATTPEAVIDTGSED